MHWLKQCPEDPVPTDNCIIWSVNEVLGNKPLLSCPKCHLMQVWKHFCDIWKCFCEAHFFVAVSVCAFSGLIKMHLMHHCNCLAYKYNITISGSGFTWTPSYTQSFLSRNNLELLSSEGIHSLFLECICLFTFLTPTSLVGSYHLMTTAWLQLMSSVQDGLDSIQGYFWLKGESGSLSVLICVRGHNIICTQQDLSGLLPGCF